MKIVVLNECFFDKQHIDRLGSLGKVVIYKDTDSEEKAIERLSDADVAIADQFLIRFNHEVFKSAKNLKFLALNTTSFSNVDLQAANRSGVKVSNVPGFSKQSVAELAIGLIFAVNRKIPTGDSMVRKAPFELDPGNKEHQSFIGFDLKGKTLGVIGMGNIGTIVARLGAALGMSVVAFNRSPKNVNGVKMVAFDELLKISDVISLHLPLSSDTRDLISDKEFKLMKANAILINTSAYEIVNAEALYKVLKSKMIKGAAIDDSAKIPKNHPLLELDSIVVTPHEGSFTKESFFVTLPQMIVENVEQFVKGKPINTVN